MHSTFCAQKVGKKASADEKSCRCCQVRDNLSYLHNCSFSWDDEFVGAPKINAGIERQGVRGIKILGCSFENSRILSTPQGFHDYGYGVRATNSQFTVTSLPIGNGPIGGHAPTYDHTGFKGLGYGVYTLSTDAASLPYQVENGVTFRMAVLYLLAGQGKRRFGF